MGRGSINAEVILSQTRAEWLTGPITNCTLVSKATEDRGWQVMTSITRSQNMATSSVERGVRLGAPEGGRVRADFQILLKEQNSYFICL